MKTIALINMKGGVGKTTLAVNLGWNLFRRHAKRVLVVDLDPQFNASQYLTTYDSYDAHRKKNGTVADVLLEPSRPRMSIREKGKPRKNDEQLALLFPVEISTDKKSYLYLLPSELDLARAVKNPQGVEFRLQKLLAQWEKYFDYVFIDCAPTDTVLTATALMAAHYVLVPIRPDRFSILGYNMMLRIIETFKQDYPDPGNVQDLGVVFTMVAGDPNAIQEQCKSDIRKAASYVFKQEIAESTSYLRSVHEQSPVFDTRFARELTKNSIDQLVIEMEKRMLALGKTPAMVAP